MVCHCRRPRVRLCNCGRVLASVAVTPQIVARVTTHAGSNCVVNDARLSATCQRLAAGAPARRGMRLRGDGGRMLDQATGARGFARGFWLSGAAAAALCAPSVAFAQVEADPADEAAQASA